MAWPFSYVSPFDAIGNGSIAISDGDGLDDVLMTGRDSSMNPISKLFINEGMATLTDDINLEVDFDLAVYPNPTKSTTLNVIFNSTENDLAVAKIYDLNRNLLTQQKEFTVIGHNIFSVDINYLTPGNYFIQLDVNERKDVAYFIVQ